MISTLIKKMNIKVQTLLSTLYFIYQIKMDKFKSSEIEWENLEMYLKEGDYCIDIGSNVGRYAIKMSQIVGNKGAVLAFEPNRRIFNILSNLIYYSGANNITLLNLGVSNKSGFFQINESWNTPKINHYFNTNTDTKISRNSGNTMTVSIDNLNLVNNISLIKIDIEGMELEACYGMEKLLTKYKPIIIVENNDIKIVNYLNILGYGQINLNNNSRNLVFKKND